MTQPFHNFDHASHVGMSVAKLMSRIVPDLSDVMDGETEPSKDNLLSTLHDHTYGKSSPPRKHTSTAATASFPNFTLLTHQLLFVAICSSINTINDTGITSDPLTQFTCVFAALIHDLDHSGVPNTTLVNEKHPLATKYKNKSVAEQNSLDIAWKLLMKSKFKDFRYAICGETGSDEERRFRQLVVNSLMATDIMDKDLKQLRNNRWDKAFSEQSPSSVDNVNRKATIVIEHLIQASDVAHTMQHWQ